MLRTVFVIPLGPLKPDHGFQPSQSISGAAHGRALLVSAYRDGDLRQAPSITTSALTMRDS